MIELIFLLFRGNEVRCFFQDIFQGYFGVGDVEYDFEQIKVGKGVVIFYYYCIFNIFERFDNSGMFYFFLQI